MATTLLMFSRKKQRFLILFFEKQCSLLDNGSTLGLHSSFLTDNNFECSLLTRPHLKNDQ